MAQNNPTIGCIFGILIFVFMAFMFTGISFLFIPIFPMIIFIIIIIVIAINANSNRKRGSYNSNYTTGQKTQQFTHNPYKMVNGNSRQDEIIQEKEISSLSPPIAQFCQYCGAKLDHEGNYCHGCGSKIRGEI